MWFLSAPAGVVTSRHATANFSVEWSDFDRGSGLATRSLQRSRVASSSATCSGTFANDGSPVTTASPSSQALVTGYCYQWTQTLTDKAGNASSCTSGKVFVRSSPTPLPPAASYTVPVTPGLAYQTSPTLNVTWTEAAGTGTITARSLQRQKASGTIGTCGLTWANDGAPDTGTSPRPSGTLAEGLYRWTQTLTNSSGVSGTTPSGFVDIDTGAPSGSISYPEANRPLTGTVTITGSATDTGSFREYQLEYGAGSSPSAWTSIGTFTSPVTGGDLATWATAGLNGVHTLRLTVREHASSTTSVITRTVVLENGGRGDEPYHTRVPYDLGGGWALDVGVANGEARLARDLFTIPSYGPSQALSLAYSSAEAGAAGRFGVGWSSNLTQYLTFELAGAITTWHRSDGGRVPFGLVGSAWTPLRGHYETLSVAGSEVTITTRDQTTYVFEGTGAGRLKRIENRFGKSLTLAWSTSSATATDASGRVTNLTIDAANNRITGVTDSAGRAWSFGYTGTGSSSKLTCVTDPAAKVTRLTYASHVLTAVVSGGATCASGGSVTWTVGYTGGKATSVRDPILANGDLFTYAAGSTTAREVVDDGSPPAYADTVYTFDASPAVAGRGIVADLTDALGTTTHRTYDGDANLLTEAVPTDDDGTANTSFEYDARGNLTRETREVTDGTVVVTVSTYNATNDLLTRTDADNDDTVRTVTRYEYDAAGHLLSENRNCTSSGTTIPGQGQGGSCTGAGTQDASTNLITRYAYTALDQLEFEQDPAGRVTKHVYDTHGNETAVIANCTSSGTTPPSPFSSCTAGGTHDAQTNVTSASAYLATDTDGKAGLPTSTTDALGRTTTYDYDALGRQKTEVLPGDASIPALTRATTYDEYGNVLTASESWTPPGGTLQTRTTTHAYDAAGRETQVTDPWTTSTVTTYDDAGNAVQTDVSGPGGTGLVRTLHTFDLLHRSTEERLASPDDPVTVRSYTTLGAVRTTALPSGVTKTQVTDFRGLATREETESGGATPLVDNHTYDRLGNELTVDDADPDTSADTTNTYDRLGRLLTTTTGGQTTTYGYDRAGNQVSVTEPAGIVTTTTYDPLDRAVTVVANDVANPTLPTEDVTTRTWYDAAGNGIAVQDARGITTRSFPNARDEVWATISNCTDTGTTTPSTNPPACTGGTPTTTANVRTEHTFDGQGNVVGTVTAVGLTTPVLYQATTETAYDAAGRVQATRDPMGTITLHVYNTAGQLTDTYVNCTTSGTTIPTDWANCTGGGTANGTFNLRTRYTYDAHGQQATVVQPNGRVTAYLYDADDRPAKVIENYVDGVAGTTDDVTTETFYDAYGRTAAVRTPTSSGATTIVTRTVYNPDGTVAAVITNCTDVGTTPPADPAACTGGGTANADTNVTTAYSYDARGNRIAVTAPDPSATSGDSAATVTTQYAYDDAGRLCRVVEHATESTDLQALAHPCTDATQTPGTASANVSTRYTHDGAGNLVSMTDARGNTTSYTYDAAGRPTGRTDPLGGQLIWRYDDAGNLTSQRNRTDPLPTYSVTWTHDPAGRILTRTADSTTTTYTYDLAGNKLTATTGTQVITATYDRLNRPLTVDDEDAGSGADTSYTYSLASPSWTDPSGAYAVTLDAFDRPTSLDDPAFASGSYTWTYRSDGRPSSFGQPNGNATASAYDALGRPTSQDTTAGGTNRALYDWTYNRAGVVLTEVETVTGGASNGTVAYGYDPAGRLTGSTMSGTTTAYGWDAVPDRTSVQVGAGPMATTTYDAADRPTVGTNPTAAYASDADGQLTARPGQTLTHDHLGRLTSVRDAAGQVTLAAYTYDPLDRLRTVSYQDGSRIRFRYVGLTTHAAGWWNDVAGTLTRSIATGWAGERLADWDPATGASSIRVYGTNAHHDLTWTAANTGGVLQSLRYDPWGSPRTSPPAGYPPFRFQGSWHDQATDLSWVVTRWYAPALGRFISEDSLLGEPADPPSRHLYAYGQGEPVGRWDPDGRKPSGNWRLANYRVYDMTDRRERDFQVGLGVACVVVGVGSFAFRLLGVLDLVCWVAWVADHHRELPKYVAHELAQVSVWRRGSPTYATRRVVVTGQIVINTRTKHAFPAVWARYPSFVYERHYLYVGALHDPVWAGVARTYLDRWRDDTKPTLERPRTDRGVKYGAFSARIESYSDPWNGRGWSHKESARWPRYYTKGNLRKYEWPNPWLP
jgi:RHS repeat-associated protein